MIIVLVNCLRALRVRCASVGRTLQDLYFFFSPIVAFEESCHIFLSVMIVLRRSKHRVPKLRPHANYLKGVVPNGPSIPREEMNEEPTFETL